MSNEMNLVENFRKAAEALESLPILQENLSLKEAELTTAEARLTDLTATVNNLQASIEALTTQVRSLEVERDDAAFREVETKDKLSNLLATFKSISGLVSETIEENEPKPEPVAEPEPATSLPEIASALTEHPPLGESTVATDTVLGNTPTEWTTPIVEELAKVGVTKLIGEISQTSPNPHYWEDTNPQDKPSAVSWKEFFAGGGRRPFWVTDEMINAA